MNKGEYSVQTDRQNNDNQEIFRQSIHDHEVELLVSYYDEFLRQVQAGKIPEKIRLINIVGYSGCGKDYIVKQFAEIRNIGVYLTNPGDSYFADSKKLWRRLFSMALQISDLNQGSAVKEKINKSFTALTTVYPRREELLEQQNLIEAIILGTPVKADLQEIHLAAYLLLTASAYWFKQSQQKPYVIYLSNVDIFPEEFLNFISSAVFLNCMDDVNTAIFLVMTSEKIDNLTGNLAAYSDYREIKISSLSQEQTACFLFEAGVDLPKEYWNYLKKLAGNLFLYKIFLELYLGGHLCEEDARDRLLNSTEPVVELLNFYSNKIDSDFLHLYQIAALIGTVFSRELLEHLCQKSGKSCTPRFFVNNRLIEPLVTDLPAALYRFKHEIIREHYLTSVAEVEQKRIYDLLIDYFKDGSNLAGFALQSQIIGGYMCAAGYLQEAAVYIKQAGDELYAGNNYRSSAKMVIELLKILPPDNDEWLDATLKLGNLYLLINNYDGAIQTLESGLNYLKKHTDPYRTWQFLTEMGKTYFAKNDLQHTLGIYEQISRLAADMGDQDKLGQALNRIGELETNLGNYEKAAKVQQHVIKNRNNFNDPSIYPQALANLGIIKYSLVDLDKAYDCFKTGLESLPADGYDLHKAKFYGYLGVVHYCREEFDTALEYYKTQLGMLYRLGKHELIGDALGNIGLIYSSQGDYDKAIQNYKKQLAVYMQEKSLISIVLCYNNIGGLYLGLGNLVQALSYYSKALDLTTKIKVRGYEARLSSNMAETYDLMNEYEDAKKYFNRAIEIDLNNKADYYLLKHYEHKGMLLFKTGCYGEALQVFRANLDLAKKSGNNESCQRSLFMIDLIFAVVSRKEDKQNELLANIAARHQLITSEQERAELSYIVFTAFKGSEKVLLKEAAVSYAKKALDGYKIMQAKRTNFFIQKRLAEIDAFLQDI